MTRLEERFGLQVSAFDIDMALLAIIDVVDAGGSRKEDDPMLLSKLQDGRELWVVRIAGRPVRVIYNFWTGTIMTVLPADHRLQFGRETRAKARHLECRKARPPRWQVRDEDDFEPAMS